MSTETSRNLCELLEALAGETAPFEAAREICPEFPASGVGYSQLNELLLSLGFDRVTHSFFQFLVDGLLEYRLGLSIGTLAELELGIERVRQLSLLIFGNVKFGFKTLARDEELFTHYYPVTQPIPEENFNHRHDPIHTVDEIPAESTYYLGYIVDAELKARLTENPQDPQALEQSRVRDEIRQRGAQNHRAYLTSDHLDVYIATSMRQRHEYRDVGEFAKRVFGGMNSRH